MRIKYAVTFEFEMRPPITHRGTMEASQVATCVSRAIRIAQKEARPKNWTSMNCVVLERIGEELPETAEEVAETA